MHSLTWGESNVMPGPTRSAKSISPAGMYTRLFFRTEVGNIVCGKLETSGKRRKGLCGRRRGPSDTWFSLIAQ